MAVSRYFVGSTTGGTGDNSPSETQVRLFGAWPESWVRRIRAHSCSAFLLGECLASSEELHKILTSSASPENLAAQIASLPGSYCAILSRGPETAVATDLAGLHRVWYRPVPRGIEFASTPLAFAQDLSRSLDPNALAARLFCPDFRSGLPGDSLYRGSIEVPPDRVLALRNGEALTRPRKAVQAHTSFSEGVEALREALETSVRARVAGARTVTADLSGGMDSSTLALLAARYRDTPLPALTYTDPFAANDDDTGYASLLAAAEPGITQVLVQGDAASLPFTGMEETPFTDHPSLNTVIFARDRTRLRPASGTSVHLAGDGGDVVLGAPLTALATLAGLGRIRHFIRESRGWARLRHRPAHRIMHMAWRTRRTTYSATLSALASGLEAELAHQREEEKFPRIERSLVWAQLGPASRWGTKGARAAVASRLREAAEQVNGNDGVNAHALRMIRRHAADTRLFLEIAEHLGARVAAPFFDNQVVAACVSVPAEKRVSVSQAKPLLRAAFSEGLPSALYARRTKGDYGTCEYHGIRRNAARLRRLLGESHLADLGLVQPRLVLAELERAVGGAYVAMAGLCDIVASEMWLRALERSPVLPRLTQHVLLTKGDQ